MILGLRFINANHFSGQKYTFGAQNNYSKMRKSIFSIFLIATTILSCSSPKELEYRTFHNLSVESLGFNQSSVSLDIEYYNPNNFGLQLRNTDLDIFINGNLLGHSSLDTLIRIPRRDTFTLPVKFAVNMQNLYKNALSTLSGKEVMVKLSGKLRIGKANVFMIFPVNYETKETFSLF
jgi:LEA14-like dessication related protein